MTPGAREPRQPALRTGDLVQVRTKEEILATLDAHGRLDGMPFMPEMLQFAGQTFPVAKRAHKACDTTADMDIREIDSAVHLADLRCDGSAHGGCETACLLFWKEAWLTRPGETNSPEQQGEATVTEADLSTLTRASLNGGGDDAKERFVCQATALHDFSRPLPFWRVGQYATDVRSGNIGVRPLVGGIALALFNKYQDIARKRLPRALQIYRGRRIPWVRGVLEKTPKRVLGLTPGERVRVRTRDEIAATLDTIGRNRGLQFDAELLEFCGREAVVSRRVSKLIDERTGELRDLPGECVVLDGFVCAGRYHRFCPRGSLPFWREIWLERTGEAAE